MTLPLEHTHKLDMRRPKELVDRQQALKAEPRVDQYPGVAAEGGGIARHADHPRHR